MRIGIDIRSIAAAGQGRGLGVYAANLVKHLTQVGAGQTGGAGQSGGAEPHFVLFLARHQDTPAFLVPTPANVTLVRLRRPDGAIVLWDQLLWYPLLQRLRIDVFHSLVYGVPIACPCPKMLTIHDLTPLIFPHLLRKLRHKLVFRFNFATGKTADHILTVSTNSQQDIMRYLGIPAARISVVFEGVGPQYRVLPDEAELRDAQARYGIAGRSVVYVGGFDAHKNLITLIRAFALLRRRNPDAALTLALVGGSGPDAAALQAELRAEIRARQLERRVVFTGYVPDEDVVRLLNAAAVCVLPSRYEGFGLPLVEALACGAPVVCSNAASLPEVGGDAALYCAPDAPAEFCDAMHAILTDPALRQTLRDNGLRRARVFSWDAAARATLALYTRLARDRYTENTL